MLGFCFMCVGRVSNPLCLSVFIAMNALSRDAEYRRVYREWVDSLPPAERRNLAQMGLDKPERDGVQASGVGLEEDACLRPEASERVDYAGLADAEDAVFCSDVAAGFAQALAWAVQGKTLVHMGQRLAAMMVLWSPALLQGVQLEIRRDLVAELQDAEWGASCPRELLEWLSRGNSLSQWGQRVLVVTYVVAPELLPVPTLREIGGFNQTTRQAVDRLVQDCRDTFSGMKSRAMRSDENRLICRTAQLARASHN